MLAFVLIFGCAAIVSPTETKAATPQVTTNVGTFTLRPGSTVSYRINVNRLPKVGSYNYCGMREDIHQLRFSGVNCSVRLCQYGGSMKIETHKNAAANIYEVPASCESVYYIHTTAGTLKLTIYK